MAIFDLCPLFCISRGDLSELQHDTYIYMTDLPSQAARNLFREKPGAHLG